MIEMNIESKKYIIVLNEKIKLSRVPFGRRAELVEAGQGVLMIEMNTDLLYDLFVSYE